MAQRRKLIVGNWKMNGRLTSGLNLARDIADKAEAAKPLAFDLVLCPPATLLWPVAEVLMGTPVLLGAQNCHAANHGAFTGEISAGMLADLGCRYVILGHSERRSAYRESNEDIAHKVAAAQLAGLTTIVCVGESMEQKLSDNAVSSIVEQVTQSLPEKIHSSQIVIAYEPVWAIGSGETPNIDDIRTVHQAIRVALGQMGRVTPILYGGSVTAANAQDFLDEPEIDGVLVGSASLSSDGFWGIAEKLR